jgi:DNA-binding transcriptional LysR family regulator
MDPNRLNRLDLNLLVVLDVLLAERNVTHAAQRLGLSQPTVSNALARLREALGDRLLVRTAQGMVPTARALAVQHQLSAALGGLAAVVNVGASFDPRTARRSFVIAATDYVQFVLLGELLRNVQRSAPGVTLELVAPRGQFPWQDLGAGIDMVVGGARLQEVPSTLHRRRIFRDRVVCLLRDGHRYAEGPLTLQRYLELDHIEALPIGSVGLADEMLMSSGHPRRRLVLTVPHFLIVPFLVAQSDCCFTLAQRIAKPLAALLQLRIRPLPYEMPVIAIDAFWHDRVHHDPAHRWLRRLLIATSARIDRRGAAGRYRKR